MSWIIQSLLRNSVALKSASDINSDEFNDLMIVEQKINNLYKDGVISDEEMALIRYMEDGKPLVNSKEGFGKNRISLSKDFVNLCNKIAFYIGGYFTDEGYLIYMKTKYHLTEEQVNQMMNYMTSKYKNKLIRKQRETDEKA